VDELKVDRGARQGPHDGDGRVQVDPGSEGVRDPGQDLAQGFLGGGAVPTPQFRDRGLGSRRLVALPIAEFSLSAKRLLGSVFGQTRPLADVERILDLYRAGRLPLDDLITRTYSLDEINKGYEDMHAGLNIRGVIDY
jgi:hypothetical protein